VNVVGKMIRELNCCKLIYFVMFSFGFLFFNLQMFLVILSMFIFNVQKC
jgi:hypothetical protein